MVASAYHLSPVPTVHAVTDDRILTRPGFVARAWTIMHVLGKAGAVHLRTSTLSAARLHEIAVALAPLQDTTGCWLAVNDRVDIAAAAGARAVQLTSRSIGVADARIAAPQLAVGASVHALNEALAAAEEGAMWLVAGNVFETPSHPGAPGRGMALLEEISHATKLPCIAIGGIKPEHARILRAAGVHGVAAIRGIWDADDAERAATEYLSAYDGSGM
ncbi:MAG: thiamine phosphate synthase [Gemmatimonadaceae bacterium]